MSNFGTESPSNEGVGVPEVNPLEKIFSEYYSFGARIYNIENDPGTAVMLPGMADEPETEFPAAETQPTPAALVPGNPGANEAWFAWSGVSPLQVSIPSGGDVRSIYITGNFDGFPVAVTSGFTVGGIMTVSPGYTKDMVPIPPGSQILTLSTTEPFSKTVYVCAYGDVWNPFDNGGGAGNLRWIEPQPSPLGSGEVYTNTSNNVQLVQVGGTSAQAFINGLSVSGGQPGTYTLQPGDEIYFIFGYDETVLSFSNLIHYYPMEVVDGASTPDSVPGNANAPFTSLQTNPPEYNPPFINTAYPITSDGAPSIEINFDNYPGGSHEDFGWNFTPGGELSGAWSIVYWFRDCGQYKKTGVSGQPPFIGYFWYLRPATGDPYRPCIQTAWSDQLDFSYPGQFMGPYGEVQEGASGPGSAYSLPLPSYGTYVGPFDDPDYSGYPAHMVTIIWDGNHTLSIGFDNDTPTLCDLTGWVAAGQTWLPPNLAGDNNGKFGCHLQLAKVAIFDTAIASDIVQELYEQATNTVFPVYEFYEVI